MPVAVNVPGYASTQLTMAGRLVEFKLCENCARPFVRAAGQGTRKAKLIRYRQSEDSEGVERFAFVDQGAKYCPGCCQRLLLPEDQNEYRELLPQTTRDKLYLPRMLPKYDDSLLPKAQRRRIREMSDRRKLVKEYREQGKSAVEIAEKLGISVSAVHYNLKKLREVGGRGGTEEALPAAVVATPASNGIPGAIAELEAKRAKIDEAIEALKKAWRVLQ